MPDTSTPEVRYLGDVQRLQLKPGDCLVVQIDRPLSAEQMRLVREHCERVIGLGVPVLVLDQGIKVGVRTPGSP